MAVKPKIIEAPFEAYFSVFLTLGCSLRCSYCIQKISVPSRQLCRYAFASGEQWVSALNAITNRTKKRFLRSPKKKKLAIIGGEPTVHPDFVSILNNLDKNWNITVTTNFASPFFDGAAPGLRAIRHRPYLRFNGSFHFLYTPWEKFVENVQKLKRSGLKLHNLFVVAHPEHLDKVAYYKEQLRKVHPDVRVQRFLGYYNEQLYPRTPAEYQVDYEHEDGIYNYADYETGFSQGNARDVYCRINKVLFAPNGDIYNCHHKLYTGHPEKLGNLFDDNVHITLPHDYFLCHDYGFCNPCDAEALHLKRLDGTEFKITR